MATNAEPVEIQVCECVGKKYMAWISGQHNSFAMGRSPLEAIGALVVESPKLFNMVIVNFRDEKS